MDCMEKLDPGIKELESKLGRALNETERVAFHAGYCFRMDVEVENMRDLLDLARKQE